MSIIHRLLKLRAVAADAPQAALPAALRNLQQTGLMLLFLALCITLIAGYHGAFMVLNHLGELLPDDFWADMTLLGDTRVALALLLLFIYRNPYLLPATLIATVPATLIVHGFKHFMPVERPAALLPPESFHHIGSLLHMGSFPSGHSTTAAVVAALLILSAKRPSTRVLVGGLMLLVAVSRVMVGAHWPVDILVGCVVGLMSGFIGYSLATRYALCRNPLCQWSVVLVLLYADITTFTHDGGYPQGHLFASLLAATALGRYGMQLLGQLKSLAKLETAELSR